MFEGTLKELKSMAFANAALWNCEQVEVISRSINNIVQAECRLAEAKKNGYLLEDYGEQKNEAD